MNTRLKPHILEQKISETRLDYLLEISSENRFFEGHFPGFPILPGVVQVGWAVELAKPLPLVGKFSSVWRLKFMRPIAGDTNIRLRLTLLDDGKHLRFKYHDDQATYSSGQICFDG